MEDYPKDGEELKKRLLEALKILQIRPKDAEQKILKLSKEYEECKIDHPEKEIALGLKNYFGLDCEKNYELSTQHFQNYIKQNEDKEENKPLVAYCIFRQAKILYNQKRMIEAIKLYVQSSDMNCREALNDLGVFHERGEGVKNSLEKANELYARAMELGDVNAIDNLAVNLEMGKGLEKNIEKAIEYYQEGGKNGYSKSFLNLAKLYLRGKDVEKDLIKAVHYFLQAGNLGNAKAFHELADLYRWGVEVTKDLDKMVEYYTKAAELGEVNAMNSLGFMYKTGKDSLEKDQEKSAHFYFMWFCHSQENKFSIEKLVSIFKEIYVNWKPEYHRFWDTNNKHALDEKVMVLLLSSKHRKDSTHSSTKFLVKGITLNIIKYLCHFYEEKTLNLGVD